MNTWTPLWSSTLDSMLWEEPPHVRLMFFTLLMMRDPDHVVRSALRVISKRANLDRDPDRAYVLAEEAMGILEAPDRKSREYQEHEGRRIEKVEDGWKVLNGEKYLEQMKGLAARVRKSQKQKQRRESARAIENHQSRPLPGERTGEQPHEWRTAPGGDLDEPPVETATSSPATSNQSAQDVRRAPQEVLHSNDGPKKTPVPVQSPSVARNRTLAEHQAARAAASKNPPSTAPNSRAIQSRPGTSAPSQPALSPASQAAQSTEPAGTVTARASSPAVPLRTPSVQVSSGRSAAQVVDPLMEKLRASVKAPQKAPSQSRPANPAASHAPVNPNQLDRMPRTEAGVIAGTGEGSAFGGWEERTIQAPKPKP